jgi:Fur family peroxide stress response transcriptional regulator
MQEVLSERMELFRERCAEKGLALTHQRLIIYEAIAATDQHPAPEVIYEHVKRKIPSISLATVYKSIRTFVDLGLLREVNLLHESLRVDANLETHHHLVCVRCKSVTDLPEQAIAPVKLRAELPGNFRAQKFNVEIQGLCARCGSATKS